MPPPFLQMSWLAKTLDICLDKLYSFADLTALPTVILRKLLKFASKKSQFLFDGKHYDQMDGVGMGSSLGPVIANIFMCDFEEKWSITPKFVLYFVVGKLMPLLPCFTSKTVQMSSDPTLFKQFSQQEINLPLNLNRTMQFRFWIFLHT